MHASIVVSLLLPVLAVHAAAACKSTLLVTKTVTSTSTVIKTKHVTHTVTTTVVTTVDLDSTAYITDVDYSTVVDYSTATVTVAPAPTYSVGFGYGCHIDCAGGDCSQRMLTGSNYQSNELTNEQCWAFCAEPGWDYAGTEDGGQCFCGQGWDENVFGPSNGCNSACTGNGGEVCGGPYAINIVSLNYYN